MSDDLHSGRARASPAPAAAQVIRTFTHHQITALPRGVYPFRPVVSSSGNRILFGVNPDDGHPPGLAIIDFDGSNLVNLDEANPIGPAALSTDGSRVAYVVNYSELRTIGSDGRDRRTLVQSVEGAIDAVRLTADGKIVYFLACRGFGLSDGKNTTFYVRGIYSIYADGTRLQRVAGPDEVAPVRGAKPDDVGNPNFRTGYPTGSMDVSADGREVIFGCYDKAGWFLIGCDNDGKNLHVISERRNQGGAPRRSSSRSPSAPTAPPSPTSATTPANWASSASAARGRSRC